jgi:hypothetical protein
MKRTRRVVSPREKAGAISTCTIIVAMNQYAEAATGNRDIFLNKPPKLGG